MDKLHCRDNRLSSPARVNLWPGVTALFLGFCALMMWAGVAQASSCPAVLDHQFPRLQDEKPVKMCQFRNQVLLVVNTASYCGYTNQYDALEGLHTRFKNQGFSVLGFPSNDFGNQEPKSNKEIADFCNNTFGVQFPMFAKTSVRGQAANPFYKQLAEATGVQPAWNFHKYLINRKGEVVGTFNSSVAPDSPEITQAIRRALDAHPITKQ